MRIFLLVLVCFILSGCIPTTTMVFINKSNQNLAFTINDVNNNTLTMDLPFDSTCEALIPQGVSFVLVLVTEDKKEYTYQLRSKEGGMLHYTQYFLVDEDMSIYVFDQPPKCRDNMNVPLVKKYLKTTEFHKGILDNEEKVELSEVNLEFFEVQAPTKI